jgi:membrane-associated phospholipid phosphatase
MVWLLLACWVSVPVAAAPPADVPAVHGQVRAAEPAADPASPDSGLKALARDLARDFAHLPSVQNLEPLGIGGGLALAVHPIDPDVNRHLYARGGVHDAFQPGNVIGNGAFEAGGAAVVYALGRATGHTRLARLGAELLRAQAMNGALTEGLKIAVGRERPDGHGRDSFPSGHTSATFASATVLARELGWKWAVPSFLVASYVAASRLHENRHYLSDVVFGASVGTIAGRTVTRHGRSAYVVSPVRVPGGFAVLIVRDQSVRH